MQRRGKRRWIFGKSLNTKGPNYVTKTTNNVSHVSESAGCGAQDLVVEKDKRHALEVAIATAAAAEAAVATAQAAVEFIRMTRPCILIREESQAAITIQKTFRGYLVGCVPNSLYNSPDANASSPSCSQANVTHLH